MNMTACLACQHRHIGCHAECEEYKAFKKELAAENEKQRQTVGTSNADKITRRLREKQRLSRYRVHSF